MPAGNLNVLQSCHRTTRLLGTALLTMISLGWECVGTATADEPAEIKVMTFNLRYASDKPPNAWQARRPVVQAAINQVRPDVIGTQEGLYRQIKDIETDLSEYAWIGLGRDGGSRGEFMAVFYRHDRLEPLEFDHFWLSDTPDRIGSTSWGNTNRRMVTWVRFRDRRASQEFYFLNTHFDHQVQPAREKSAELVVKRVDQLLTKLPIILVGDFNAAAGDNRAYDTLTGAGKFTDSWLAAKKHGDAIGTFHNYAGPRAGGARIDWILMRGPVVALSTEVITFAQQGQYPSDHFPVVATLAWQQP
jgi:endonuclease/exonuclease/phosphatase family metal-dependent hydrolase